MGPQFCDTVYISEVNEARKVKFDAQVAMNKTYTPCRNVFLKVWLGTLPQLIFFQISDYCPKRVELGSSYSGSRLI